MKRQPLSIRRRAEIALAKLQDLLSRGAPKSNLEALRRNEEFMQEVELHCKGALRNGMLLMAEKFDEVGATRVSGFAVAEMLRNAEESLKGEPGYMGGCPACGRPHEEHGRYYIADRFEVAICLGLPRDMLIMVGPQTAHEFHKESLPFIPEGPVGVNSLPTQESPPA